MRSYAVAANHFQTQGFLKGDFADLGWVQIRQSQHTAICIVGMNILSHFPAAYHDWNQHHSLAGLSTTLIGRTAVQEGT